MLDKIEHTKIILYGKINLDNFIGFCAGSCG